METEPIIKEVVVNAPVSIVWNAITDKNEMENWYFTIEKFKPEAGFEFRFYAGSEEKKYLHLCKIIEVVEKQKLSYTWAYEDVPVETVVTFELFDEGNNKTKVRLTHKGADNFPADNKDFAKESFIQGWDQIIGVSLKNYLEKV